MRSNGQKQGKLDRYRTAQWERNGPEIAYYRYCIRQEREYVKWLQKRAADQELEEALLRITKRLLG